MNRKIISVFFLIILCSQLFIDTANAATKKKKKPKRPLVLDMDKRLYLSNNVDFIGEYIAPVSRPFQPGSGEDSISLTEFFKAMIVGVMSMHPASAVAAIFVDSIWSAFIENSSEDKNDAISDAYISMINQIIDQKIYIYDQSQLYAEYVAVNTSLVSYKNSVVTFNEDPSKPVHGEAVRRDFDIAEQALRSRLDYKGAFAKQGYELASLPVFAIGATLYFMMQVDVARNGASWGYSSSQLKMFYRYYEERMSTYTEYVKKQYQDGYNRFFNSIPVESRDKSTLNKINRYRRTLIPQVCDYAAMWWTFNATLFPDNNAYGERVRYLYSDVFGQPIDTAQTPSFNPSYYDPSLTRLQEMSDAVERERYRGEMLNVKISVTLYQWFWNIQSTFYDVSSSSKKRVGKLVGNQSPPSGSYVTTSELQRRYYQPNIGHIVYDVFPQIFQLADNSTHSSGSVNFLAVACYGRTPEISVCYDYYNSGGQLVSENWSLEGSKIGDVFGWNENKYIGNGNSALDAMQIAFIPADVFSNNLILKKSATIIDAQKSMKNKDTKIMNDYVMPGVHAISLSDKGFLTFLFDSEANVKKSFKIFLRAHHNGQNDSEIRMIDPKKNGNVIAKFKIKANKRDQSVFPISSSFELELGPGEKNNSYTFKAFGTGCILQSIVFIPQP